MFDTGFNKIAKKAGPDAFKSLKDSLKKGWKSVEPYAKGALEHLKSQPAGYGAAAGALGGAVSGATSRDEYGRLRGLEGAISGGIKGGVTGGIAGAAYNRYHKGPAVSGKPNKPKPPAPAATKTKNKKPAASA